MAVVGLNSLLLQVFYSLPTSDYVLVKARATWHSQWQIIIISILLCQHICPYLPPCSHHKYNIINTQLPSLVPHTKQQ